MLHPGDLSILDFDYLLPAEKIALHPSIERDDSRLLIYKKGVISEAAFRDIAKYLEPASMIIFNNTRVINARLRFKKKTGGGIEVFCLEPLDAVSGYDAVIHQKGSSTWKCLVGGAAKWKNEVLQMEIYLNNKKVLLKASQEEKEGETFKIKFSWEPAEFTFAEVIAVAGEVPLPPYIKRVTEEFDKERYQTIYAKEEGSVAAPTAGLHFTDRIMTELRSRNINYGYVTLHVGAGTFKPVKSSQMRFHEMHEEWIEIKLETLKTLAQYAGNIVAIGTTSLRTLETVYWLGVKALLHPESELDVLSQWEVYESPLEKINITRQEAMKGLVDWMEKKNKTLLTSSTKLLIAPGYRFRVVNTLVTNFHQPQSTLLLLVSAAIGDKWKQTYQYALDNNFRFLSYGDANLIFIDQPVI